MSFRDLYAHMQWADAEVWRALGSIEDDKIHGLLLHLHVVQRAFFLMWTDGPLNPEELYAKKDAAMLQAFARETYRLIDDELPRLEARLGDIVQMPWLPVFEQQLGRKLNAPTMQETLIQVPSHATYHRGQVNLRLREAGGEPPNVDFITWIWFGRPSPNW